MEIKKEEPEKKEEEKKEEISIPEESIQMVMEHTKCTREKAIEALKKANDPINAIMELTN